MTRPGAGRESIESRVWPLFEYPGNESVARRSEFVNILGAFSCYSHLKCRYFYG